MTAEELASAVGARVTVFEAKPASLSGHCKGIRFLHRLVGPLPDGSDPSLARQIAVDGGSVKWYASSRPEAKERHETGIWTILQRSCPPNGTNMLGAWSSSEGRGRGRRSEPCWKMGQTRRGWECAGDFWLHKREGRERPFSTRITRMHTDMKHEELTERLIGAAYGIHKTLGFGFLDKVYDNALAVELRRAEACRGPRAVEWTLTLPNVPSEV